MHPERTREPTTIRLDAEQRELWRRLWADDAELWSETAAREPEDLEAFIAVRDARAWLDGTSDELTLAEDERDDVTRWLAAQVEHRFHCGRGELGLRDMHTATGLLLALEARD